LVVFSPNVFADRGDHWTGDAAQGPRL